ncbi:cytidylyltransferase domain-containing protein [Natrialbaceae archaeon A-arb3/5]
MSDIIAIIPARGGSSRIPEKNIRKLAGKPLIAHTIEDALESEMIDSAIVSTDDEKIATIAKEFGGDVPFLRPEELATDTAPTTPVITHALDWIKDNRGVTYDIIVLLQVTSPFRKSKDIDEMINKLLSTEATSAISTTEYNVPPQWAVSKDSQGYLCPHYDDSPLWSESPSRSQDFTLEHPNGAIFSTYVKEFRETETFYTDQTVGYKMPPERSIDIDEPFDFQIAKALLESSED